jgi:hypothetical protein
MRRDTITASAIAAALAATTLSSAQNSGYARFTQASDTIRILGNTAFTGTDWTYEMRIRFASASSLTRSQIISEQRDALEDKTIWLQDGVIRKETIRGYACGDSAASPSIESMLGQWLHLAWVRSGTNLTLFVNGTATQSWRDLPACTQDRSDSWMSIGMFRYGAGYVPTGPIPSFLGDLDWVRISDGARYTAEFSPPYECDIVSDPQTQLLLRFNEPAGTTVLVDESPSQFQCELGIPVYPGVTATAPSMGSSVDGFPACGCAEGQGCVLHVPSEYSTIQSAIIAANAQRRTIQVAPGTYPGPVDFLGKDIVLVGAGIGQSVISGNGGAVKSVVYVEGSPATARLEGFSIVNGATGQGLPDDPASLCGGGLLVVNSGLTVKNCRFEDNYATYGGGAYFRYGSAKVEGCEFVGNVAASRGGGSDAFESTTSFADCFYYDNRAAIGGGMQLVRGQHVVERTRVELNFAGSLGGGIHWHAEFPSASLVLRDSVVVDNSSKGEASGVSVFLATSAAQTQLEGTQVCGNLPRNISGGPYAADAASEVCDCRADVVLDGIVGAPDIAQLLGAWGPAAPGAAADINMDGVVNASDVSMLLASWGPCVSE